jgi:uncharacterized protein (TIGR00290 family)
VKTLLAWSSGKDSAWALHLLRQKPDVEVVGLLTSVNAAVQRVSMHAVRQELAEAQAVAAGLPLLPVRLPDPCPNPAYQAAMAQAMAEARAEGVEAVAFGDLFLEDVREYRESQMRGTGMRALFPLWGRPTAELAQEMLAGGLRAFITCVDPRALPPRFAGRRFDRALLEELPVTVDPCGEKGEFHTFVWDGPMFRGPVPVETGETVERDGFVFTDLIPGQPECSLEVEAPGCHPECLFEDVPAGCHPERSSGWTGEAKDLDGSVVPSRRGGHGVDPSRVQLRSGPQDDDPQFLLPADRRSRRCPTQDDDPVRPGAANVESPGSQ